MAISTNSIIHYTKDFNSLKSILKEGLKVKYCYERVESSGKKYLHAAFPMVSFCDIPLSQVKTHLDLYGDYGIGLRKEWAKEKGLNPVLYFDQNSELINLIRVEFQRLIEKGSVNEIERKDYAHLFNILAYSKNYQADLERSGKIIKNYRFYDEREWRYVPNATTLNSAKSWVSEEYYSKDKKKYNDSLNHIRLPFKPEDISYIIVKSDSEIKNITSTIRNIFSVKCTLQEMEILLTRIITSDQIRSDF